MSYGLRTRNDNNEVQIDSEWKTLRRRESGTTSTFSGGKAFVNLTSGCRPSDGPLFATHSTTVHTVAHTPVVDEAFLTNINLNSPLVELVIQRAGGTPLTTKWLVVDSNTATVSADTYGLRVRNENGDPVFDSRQDLVLIRDVLLIGASGLLTRTFSHATCRGTPYYVSGMRRAYDSPPGLEPVLYTRNINASSVSVFFQAGNRPGAEYGPLPVPLIVLDVFE
jgi:hypothetical protein